MRSLRARLLLGTALGVGAAFAIAGALVYTLARASLLERFDAGLVAEARAVTPNVEQEGDDIDTDLSAESLPGSSWTLWSARCTLGELACAGMPPLAIVRGNAEQLRPAPMTFVPAIGDATLPDGRHARRVTYWFAPRQDGPQDAVRPAVLVLARPTTAVDDEVAHLARILIEVGGLATLACVALLAGIVWLGLRPARAVAAEIAALRADNLSVARVSAAGAPAELRPIVDRLNELLGRLDAAFTRERELTAEIAHELRTPLAGLRATIEVALDRERTADRYRTALTECLAICASTERTVQALLTLARLDAGRIAAHRERVVLDELVRDTIGPLHARAEERALTIATDLAPVTTMTDREQLRVVLHNLLDNAISYADQGGTIRVSLGRGPVIRVANTGCTLAPEQVAHVFERFWRSDAARTGGVHAGLGLALCRKLVELLGGRITAAVDDGQFVATVMLSDTSEIAVDDPRPSA